MASSADSTSEADSGRSDGSLAKRRMIKASKDLGHWLLCHVGLTGGVLEHNVREALFIGNYTLTVGDYLT